MESREKLEIRNPKFETNSNDQKAQTSKPARFGFQVRQFGFGYLFRSAGLLSIFGFRILFRWRLGAINFVEVVLSII